MAAGVAVAGSSLDAPKLASLSSYVEAIAARHSDGGVFGAKVHRYQFLQLEHDRLADSPLDLLPRDCSHDARLVLLTREDRRRQAISIFLARASGVYAVSGEHGGAELPRQVDPRREEADFGSPSELAEALDTILATIAEHERGWRAWCEASGLELLSLTYESLCEDYPGTVDRVMRHVTGAGVDRGAVPLPRLGIQRGAETERLLRLWTEQGEPSRS